MKSGLLSIVLTLCAAIFALSYLATSFFQQALLPLVAAFYLLGGTALIGLALATRLKLRDLDFADHLGLGVAFTIAFFFSAAALHRLNPAVIIAYLLLPPAAVLLAGPAEVLRWWRSHIVPFFVRPGWPWPALAVPLVFAVLPPVFFDSLVYHLGIPNLYLQHGGFCDTHGFMYANTAVYSEIFLVPAVFLGPFVPQLLHFLLGVVTVLTAGDFLRDALHIARPQRFFLLLLSLPMTLFLLVNVKNDLSGAFFILLAVRAYRRPWVSGLWWGLALGVKYFNALALLVFWLVHLRFDREYLRRTAVWGLLVLVVLTPLFVKNYLACGNPFFPFLHSLFPPTHWDEARQAVMVRDVGRAVSDAHSLLLFPYRASITPLGFGGFIGPVFLMFLPLAFGLPAPRRLLAFALLLFVAAGFFTASMRFVFIAVVIMAGYVVKILEIRSSKVLTALFAIVLLVNGAVAVIQQESLSRAHPLLAGKVSIPQYLAEQFPAYPLIDHINRTVPAEAHILVAGESRNFYLQRRYSVSSALDHSLLRPFLNGSGDAATFFRSLAAAGYSHLLIDLRQMERMVREYQVLTTAQYNELGTILPQRAPLAVAGTVRLYGVTP